MRLLFSDKWAPLGFVVALAVFALLEWAAVRHGSGRYVDFDHGLSQPERFHDRLVEIMSATVIGPELLRKNEIDIPVRGLPPAKPGDSVHALGRLDRAGYIEILSAQVHTRLLLRRIIMYAISMGVLLGLLLLAARVFRTGLADGLFEEREDA